MNWLRNLLLRPSYGYEGCTLWTLIFAAFSSVVMLVLWLFGPRVMVTALEILSRA